MSTIVERNSDGHRFILLGAGFGAWRSETPHLLFGNWSPNRNDGTHEVLCVCDAEGTIGWLHVSEARVVSVSGQDPGGLLTY